MFSPRSIVRASVVALSVIAISGGTFSAQAAPVDKGVAEVVKVVKSPSPAAVEFDSVVSVPVTFTNSLRASAVQRSSRSAAFRESRAPLAKDMVGVHRSAYTGKFYTKRADAFRKCVVERESSGFYKVTGGGNLDGKPGGDYQGAYQLSPALARGAAYMMAKESKKTNDGLREEALSLVDVPANKWSRYWQDRAFFTVLNWDGGFSGKQHWAGGRWHC